MTDRPFFITVFLIVTGDAEREHLPKLFSSLAATGLCTFKVLRQAQQLTPRTPARRLKMVGERGSDIPTRAETEISIPARLCLRGHPARLLLLLDDIEHSRRDRAREVLAFYRKTLGRLLDEEEKDRAAVFFLVNMLEAYFFAQPETIRRVFEIELEEPQGDPEEIRHPKGDLQRAVGSYREIEDGGAMLDLSDLEKILADPDTCAWMRTCVGWLIDRLAARLNPAVVDPLEVIVERCRLGNGRTIDWLRQPSGS